VGTEADSEITLMGVGLSLTGAVGGAVGSSTCVGVWVLFLFVGYFTPVSWREG